MPSSFLVTTLAIATFAAADPPSSPDAGPVPSTVQLTTSDAAPVFAEPLTFTATVTMTNAGSPTGNVTFKANAFVLGTAALVSGVATLTTNPTSPSLGLLPGPRSFTAVYSGDALYGTASSPPLTETISAAKTTVIVTSSNPVTTEMQNITLTATVLPVAPSARFPNGTVTFFDGQTRLPWTAAVDSHGVASSLIPGGVGVGDHSITAVYNGTAEYTSSTSPAIDERVSPLGAFETLIASGTPSPFGAPVTFTATVMPDPVLTATPTGTVSFSVDGSSLRDVSLDAKGAATVTIATLPPGSHTIVGSYGGDAQNGPTSATVIEEIDQVPTTTILDVTPDPALPGELLLLDARVTAGAGETPDGTVTYYDGTTSLGSLSLTSGRAAYAAAALPLGSHAITASYAGSARFAPSTSPPIVEIVSNHGPDAGAPPPPFDAGSPQADDDAGAPLPPHDAGGLQPPQESPSSPAPVQTVTPPTSGGCVAAGASAEGAGWGALGFIGGGVLLARSGRRRRRSVS